MDEIIKNNRPKLSPSTILTYINCLKRILKDNDLTYESPLTFIENIDKILLKAEELSPSIRKSRIAAIVVLLDDKIDYDSKNEIYLNPEKQATIRDVRYIMKRDSKTVDSDEIKQQLSEKQKTNFITQDEVMDIYKNLREQTIPLFKLKVLKRRQFESMQLFILLSLYVLIAPRRTADFQFFRIRNIDKDKDNYFIPGKNKKSLGQFVFNKYKNSKTIGTQIVDNIPKELENIIYQWMTFNKSDHLLVTNQGTQVSGSKIAIMLNNIFDKKISTSMLRHIYLSDKFGKVNLQSIKDTTHAMGNSDTDRILKYVQRDNTV